MQPSHHPPPSSSQPNISYDTQLSPSYSQDVVAPWDQINSDVEPTRPKSRGKREDVDPHALNDNIESDASAGELEIAQIHGSNSNNVNSNENDWKVWKMLQQEEEHSEEEDYENEHWDLGKPSAEDEYYKLSNDQQQALLELELIQSGYLAELPEYDVSERIKKLNMELEKDDTPVDDLSREHKVNFKEELVDLVAPPPEYESDFTEEEALEDETTPLVWLQSIINENSNNKNEDKTDSQLQSNKHEETSSLSDNSESSGPSRTKEHTVESPLTEVSQSDNLPQDGRSMDYYSNDYTDPHSSDESESSTSESDQSDDDLEIDPAVNESTAIQEIDHVNNHALDNTNVSKDDKTNDSQEGKQMIENSDENENDEDGITPGDPDDPNISSKEHHSAVNDLPKEQVIVERDGKFILVGKGDMEANDSSGYFKDELDTERDMSLNGTFSGTTSISFNESESRPVLSRHSKSTPPSNSRSHSPAKSASLKGISRPLMSRSHSAQGDSRRGAKSETLDSRPVTASYKNRENYKSPYGLSDEEKKRRIKLKREKEEKSRREQEELDEKRRQERISNEQAFQAWLQSKREDAARKRQHDTKSNKSDSSRKEINESYFEEWLKSKKTQQKKERALRELEEAEFRASLVNRSQQDCDKAFQKWLRRKNKESKENEKKEKQKQRLARLSMRQSRKSQALARAIQQANAIHSLEYFGYRS